MSQRTAEGYSEFIYQEPNMLKLQVERDENGKTKVQYTMGAGLEAMRRDAGGGMASGDSSFYHYNHLGTTVALTNAAESVSDTYRHDAWGVRLASTGSTVNPHTYVGQQRYYWQGPSELYHLGVREYDPGDGIFLSFDPIQLVGARLAYVENQVTVAVDPDGRIKVICCGPSTKTGPPVEVGRKNDHYRQTTGPCVAKSRGREFKGLVFAAVDQVEYRVPSTRKCWFCCFPNAKWSVAGESTEYGFEDNPAGDKCVSEGCALAYQMIREDDLSNTDYVARCMDCCAFRYAPVPEVRPDPGPPTLFDMKLRDCKENCSDHKPPVA